MEDKEPYGKQELRPFFFEFLKDFRDYLAEYVRETVVELTVAEIPVSREVILFDGFTPGKAIIKNQGFVSCFISTNRQGGYRLDPGETIEFFVNHQVLATTVSGTTTLGFIRT